MRPTRRTPAPWLRIVRAPDGRIALEGQRNGLLGHQVDEAGRDRPGGVYAEWHWDGAELVVRNDRAGMGQLLYATLAGGQGIALSPHVDQLLELGAERRVDDQALSCLLRLGFHLGVDTPFQSIRALPPHATLRWHPGQLAVESAWEPLAPSSVSRAQAIDGYVELFAQAMDRRPPQPGATVVPLTGGHDSRHIVLELCRRGLPPDLCVTVRRYPRLRYDDASVAADVAQRLGIQHQRIDLSRTIVQEDFRKYAQTGPLSDEGSWASVMWDVIRNFQCAYDGIAGDVLALERLGSQAYDRDFHDAVSRRAWRQIAERIINHYAPREDALTPLLAVASFRDVGREAVIDRIETELGRMEAWPHPLGMFVLCSRTRREIAMMPWLLCSPLARFYGPYLDADLFDFLARLPAEMFVEGGFHRAVIARGYPEHAEMPYFVKSSEGGRPVTRFEAVQSIAELNWYAARRLPALLGVTSRWGMQRLASGAGLNTAPRRVVQHFLVLEQLLRNGRYV